MTLADTTPEIEQSESSPPATEEPEAAEPRRRRNWRRPVAITVAATLGVVLVLALFVGPVERLWYRSRQHHLAADLKVAREGLGRGQALGVLQVPRLGINVVVVQGDSPALLRGGPGHRISSALPGARGNAVITGHRAAWGGPFGRLDKIRKRDFVVIQSRGAKSGEFKTFVYRATAVGTVSQDGSRALIGRSKDHRLTLVTGRGGAFSSDRLVVSAVSGRASRRAIPVAANRATTPGSSVFFSTYSLFALIAFGCALVAYRYLRGRAGKVARAFVLAPLLVAGTLFVLLGLTLLLPPLA